VLHKYHGDVRPESASALYPHIVVYKPYSNTFHASHSDGRLEAQGFKTYDECVEYILLKTI
jgi:hypothetical protein